MKLQAEMETGFNRIGRDGHTGFTNNSRSVQLVCLYLFEYQDAYQINTNIRIIRIYSNNGIRMGPLPSGHPCTHPAWGLLELHAPILLIVLHH